MQSAIKTEKLSGVQFGRAVAAFLVVFYHAGRMLALPQYLGHIPQAGNLFSFGNAGVDFFFTLSGFIIYYVHQGDIGKPRRLGHYIWRRLTRIYPMYWLATAIVVAFAILKHDWTALTVDHLVRSIVLLPGPQDPLLGVGWTLTHEMLFYTVFAVAIGSRSAGVSVAIIWVLLIVDGFFYKADIPVLRFAQSPYHIEFALGIFSAMAARRWQTARSWMAVVAGLVLFASAATFVDLNWLSISQIGCRFLFGFSSALILYGAAVIEILGFLSLPGWAAFLGAASYSIYLFHTIFIGLLAKLIFHNASASTLVNGTFFGISTVAILAGCIMFQLIEIPLQTSVRQIGHLSKGPRLHRSTPRTKQRSNT